MGSAGSHGGLVGGAGLRTITYQYVPFGFGEIVLTPTTQAVGDYVTALLATAKAVGQVKQVLPGGARTGIAAMYLGKRAAPVSCRPRWLTH